MSVLESVTVWDLGVWLLAAAAVVVVAVAAVRLSTCLLYTSRCV